MYTKHRSSNYITGKDAYYVRDYIFLQQRDDNISRLNFQQGWKVKLQECFIMSPVFHFLQIQALAQRNEV